MLISVAFTSAPHRDGRGVYVKVRVFQLEQMRCGEGCLELR